MQHHCERVESVECSVRLGDLLKYTPDCFYRYLIPASKANTYRLIILFRLFMNRNPHHVPVSHVLEGVFEQVVHTGYEVFYGVGVEGGRGLQPHRQLRTRRVKLAILPAGLSHYFKPVRHFSTYIYLGDDSLLSRSLARVSFTSGVNRPQINRRRRVESYINTERRVRAVNTWYCSDDLSASCSPHSATRVGLLLVCYLLRHAHVSLVRMWPVDVSITTCSDTHGAGVCIASVSIQTYAGGRNRVFVSTGAVSEGACLYILTNLTRDVTLFSIQLVESLALSPCGPPPNIRHFYRSVFVSIYGS